MTRDTRIATAVFAAYVVLVGGIMALVLDCRAANDRACESDGGVYVMGTWGYKCIPR